MSDSDFPVEQPPVNTLVRRLVLFIGANETRTACLYFETADDRMWRVNHGPCSPDPLGELLSRKSAQDPVVQRVVLQSSWEWPRSRNKYSAVQLAEGRDVPFSVLLPEPASYRVLSNNGKHHILRVLGRLLALEAISGEEHSLLYDKVASALADSAALLDRKWPRFLKFAAERGVTVPPGSKKQVDDPEWEHSALAAKFMR